MKYKASFILLKTSWSIFSTRVLIYILSLQYKVRCDGIVATPFVFSIQIYCAFLFMAHLFGLVYRPTDWTAMTYNYMNH